MTFLINELKTILFYLINLRRTLIALTKLIVSGKNLNFNFTRDNRNNLNLNFK